MARWQTAALLGAVSLLGLTGCGGGSTYVIRRPQWDFASYPRVAVVPARPVDQRAMGDAEFLADQLTSRLAQNSAFDVLSRTELDQVFTEQDLSHLTDAIDAGTALPEGKMKVAQALVVPKITSYDLQSTRSRSERPIYGKDRRGRRRQVGTKTIWVHTSQAAVAASVRVVDAATGRVLFSHSTETLRDESTGRDRPPSRSPEQLATRLLEKLVDELYGRVAPVQVKVDLDKDMLVVARSYFDGRYDDMKKVARSLSHILLVVRELPASCEQNGFRVAIAAEEGLENLFEQEFTWEAGLGKRGMSYEIPLDLLTGSGAEKFVAKLYSQGDPEPILERDFELDEG
jgi:hypothetical protein